jgi:hypothetical protein
MSEDRRSARAGAISGRGYRFQDAVAGYLAVLGAVGDLALESIYCEGLEDVTFETSEAMVCAQVKSRRPDLSPHSIGHVAADISFLVRRHRERLISNPNCRVAYVAESLPAGLSATGWDRTLTREDEAFGKLVAAFGSIDDSPSDEELLRVSLISAPTPDRDAAMRLSEHFNLVLVASQLVFLRFKQALADSADANHDGVAVSYTKTDLENLRVAALETINLDALKAAISDGFVEPLDLVTRVEEAGFYLGVDVQPGHLASGYLVPRQDETDRMVNELRERRALLVAGPSGAGKSALTWMAAEATAHEIVWYRVKRLTADAVEPIARLSRSLGEGASGVRVGFIVDDVGKTPGPWDDLTEYASTRPGLIVLGSIREEDLALLASKQSVAIERPVLDEQLAEAIYARLVNEGNTSWAAWREPFELCAGLLLEYVHILSAGTRFEQTISAQVEARLADATRHDELAVLRLVAMADTYGCEVNLQRLRAELDLADDQLGFALRRLFDEHLIREGTVGFVGGLHELRSDAIVRAAHAMGSPTEAETALRLLSVLEGVDLTVAVAALLEPSFGRGDILRSVGMATVPGTSVLEPQAIQEALRSRLASDPRFTIVTSILQGLRVAGFRRTAREWLTIMDDLQVPVNARQVVATLGLTETDLTGGLFPDAWIQASERMRTCAVIDYREGMAEAVANALHSSTIQATIGDLEYLLLASARWDECTDEIRQYVGSQSTNLVGQSSLEQIKLLEAATVHAEATAQLVAQSLGGESQLLDQYAAQQPWLFDVGREVDANGVAVVAAKWLHIDTAVAHGDISTLAIRDAENVHDAVVAVCRDLIALQPSASFAKVSAVNADDALSGFGDYVIADKTIDRKNLPTNGDVVWNRIRLATVDMVAPKTSTTDRLVAESSLLEALAHAMSEFASHWVVGAYSQPQPQLQPQPQPQLQRPAAAEHALTALDQATAEASLLPSPSSPVSTGVMLRRLSDPMVMPELPVSNPVADVVNTIASNIASRMLQSDDGWGSVGAHIGNSAIPALESLLESYRWDFIDTDPSASITALLTVMQDLHDILVGLSGSPERAIQRIRNQATGRPDPLRSAAERMRTASVERVNRIKREMTVELQRSVGVASDVEIMDRPCEDRYGMCWPPTDYCVLVRGDDPLALARLGSGIGATREALIPPLSSLVVMPVFRNQASPQLATRVFETVTIPSPSDGESWAHRLGLEVLGSPGWVAATALLGALFTMSAILSLRCRRGLRPIEISVHERAEADFSNGVRSIYRLARASAGEAIVSDDSVEISPMTDSELATIPGQALAVILSWAMSVDSEEDAITEPASGSGVPGEFASRVSRMMRGDDPSLLAQVTGVNILLLLHDVDSEPASQFA